VTIPNNEGKSPADAANTRHCSSDFTSAMVDGGADPQKCLEYLFAKCPSELASAMHLRPDKAAVPKLPPSPSVPLSAPSARRLRKLELELHVGAATMFPALEVASDYARSAGTLPQSPDDPTMHASREDDSNRILECLCSIAAGIDMDKSGWPKLNQQQRDVV